MMAALPHTILPRVGSLLRLLGSDHDHEALGAVRALRRTLSGAGVDLHTLADAVEHLIAVVVERPEPAAPRRSRKARPGDMDLDFSRRVAVSAALRRGLAGGRLSEWETGFAQSIVVQIQSRRGWLTGRQGETLGRLLVKIGEGAAWA